MTLLIAAVVACSLASRPASDAPASHYSKSEGKPEGKPSQAKTISGWVEKVVMLPSRTRVSAKLDSGARTSSIHAEEIERFEKEGEPWVRFTLVLGSERDGVQRIPSEAPIDRKVRIKQHDDPPESRPVVELDFCMAGQRRRAQFSLVDREAFIYPVLLGRRFLAGHFVIDPDATFLTSAGCGPEDAREEDAPTQGQVSE